MTRFSKDCRKLLLGLSLALAASSAFAEPTYNVSRRSFADSNNNGLIDCGEIVTLQLVVFDNEPADMQASGRITFPSDFPSRWSFLAGTVQQDHAFTVRCEPTIVRGNGSNDGAAIIDYSCLTGSDPNTQGYVLTMILEGFYSGPSGSIRIPSTAEVSFPQALTLSHVFTDANVASCATVDLSLSKSDGSATATRGQTLAYTLTYRNNGASTATNTTLSETVPAHTTFNPATSSPGWVCMPNNNAGSQCSLVHGGLVPGGSGAKTFAVDVLPTAPLSVTSLTNTATISSAVADSNAANNTATDTTPLSSGTPNLVVTKTFSNASAVPGSVAASTITVTNAGTGWAGNVAITDNLPARSTFRAPESSAGWTCSTSTCSISLGDLAPGASLSRTLAVRLDSPFPAGASDLTNSACASTATAGDAQADNCATASIPVNASASLSLAKSLASGTASPGATLVYGLTVTNSGNQDAAGVVLSETVPPHSTFSPAASSPGWVCSSPAAGGSCSLSIAGVSGGASASRTFAVTLANPLPAGVNAVRNTACVGAACSSVETPTDGSPSLAISKTPVAGSPKPGEALVYSITLQNTGNQAADAVSLRETVPAHTFFDAASSDPRWTCAGTTPGSSCSLNVGSVSPSESPASFRYAVRVERPLSARVTTLENTACARRAGAPDVCSTVRTVTQGSPQLAISKSLNNGPPTPGAVLVYSLGVTNSGDQVAADVTLSEVVPANSTFSPPGSSPGWTCSPASGASGAICTLTIATLGATSTDTRLFAIKLADPFDAEAVTNTACASTAPSLNVCSTVSHPRAGKPDVRLTKSYAGPTLQPGALVPFTLTVANAGTGPAQDLLLVETVPAGSTFAPAASDPRWQCVSPAASSRCTLSLPSLAAGASAEITFAVRAATPLPASLRQISNAACLAAADSGEALACDDISTPLPTAVEATLDDRLATDQDGDGRLDSGDTLSYRLVLTNPSASTVTALTITTEIDPHLALIVGSVETTAGSIASGSAAGDATVTIALPQLAPGGSVTITFDVLALDLSGLASVASQALVRASNIEDEPSDDPETRDLDDDPTVTPLQGSPIPAIPTLSSIGILLLVVCLAALGARRMRRQPLPQQP